MKPYFIRLLVEELYMYRESTDYSAYQWTTGTARVSLQTISFFQSLPLIYGPVWLYTYREYLNRGIQLIVVYLYARYSHSFCVILIYSCAANLQITECIVKGRPLNFKVIHWFSGTTDKLHDVCTLSLLSLIAWFTFYTKVAPYGIADKVKYFGQHCFHNNAIIIHAFVTCLCSPNKFQSIKSNEGLLKQMQEDAAKCKILCTPLMTAEMWDEWYSGLWQTSQVFL